MNREIKFRAWDRLNKKWANMEELLSSLDFFEASSEHSIAHLSVKTEFTRRNEPELKKENFSEGLIWVQYTGLKDKNGKEIFEGDILHEFRKTTAPMANNGVDRKFEIKIPDCFYERIDCVPGDIEVIGNVHNNPELLSS